MSNQHPCVSAVREVPYAMKRIEVTGNEELLTGIFFAVRCCYAEAGVVFDGAAVVPVVAAS